MIFRQKEKDCFQQFQPPFSNPFLLISYHAPHARHVTQFPLPLIRSPHSKGGNLVGSKFCGVFPTFVLDVVLAQLVVKTFEATLTMYCIWEQNHYLSHLNLVLNVHISIIDK